MSTSPKKSKHSEPELHKQAAARDMADKLGMSYEEFEKLDWEVLSEEDGEFIKYSIQFSEESQNEVIDRMLNLGLKD